MEEARDVQLQKDVTLTQVDSKTREAAAEWSAYGNNNNASDFSSQITTFLNHRRRVTVQEKERNSGGMTQDEIWKFQQEFGVEYDPYYDDPYTEEELPTDIPYKVDKLYGDRIYQDGEIFYKDQDSGLYY